MANYNLNISEEIDQCLTGIALRSGITKAECKQRAFALLKIPHQYDRKGDGLSLGVVRKTKDSLEAVTQLVGIF